MSATTDRIEAYLRHRIGCVVTREELYRHVWAIEPGMGVLTRTLDVHICKLRKKLPDGDRIIAVWGIGYRMTSDNADDD